VRGHLHASGASNMENSPWYPLSRELCGSQSLTECFGGEKNQTCNRFCPQLLWSFSLWPSHSTGQTNLDSFCSFLYFGNASQQH